MGVGTQTLRRRGNSRPGGVETWVGGGQIELLLSWLDFHLPDLVRLCKVQRDSCWAGSGQGRGQDECSAITRFTAL